MKKLGSGFALLGALALFFAGSAFCQSSPSANPNAGAEQNAAPSTTKIAGIVRTVLNVPVPWATVRVVHLASGRSWATWTDEDGRFSLPELPAGRYRLEAKQLGFGKCETEVDFAAGTAAEAQLTLKVDLSSTSEAETKLEAELQPSSAAGVARPAPARAQAVNPAEESSSVKTKKRAETTPPGKAPSGAGSANKDTQEQPSVSAASTNKKTHHKGFRPVDATQTAGAATNDATQDTNNVPADGVPGDPGALGALGQASSSDAFLMAGTVGSGMTASTLGSGSNLGSQNPEATPEFQDQSAEEGSSEKQPGKKTQKGHHVSKKVRTSQDDGLGEGVDSLWVRNILNHKSANRVRFGGYERYDNAAWDARPYNIAGPPQPKLGYYVDKYGANLGGPFIVPHVYNGRDRTFFFVSYEAERTSNATDQLTTVPTLNERNGDFTGTGVQLFDPNSSLTGPRTPLGDVIPRDRLDKAALGLLQFIPLPNLPGTVNNFNLHTALPLHGDWMNVKFLHTFSPKWNLQATYFFYSQRRPGINGYPSLTSEDSTRGQNLTLGLTQNLTPRFIHNTRINWNRLRDQQDGAFAFRRDIAREIGINDVSQAPIDWGVPLVKFINIGNLLDTVPLLTRNQTFRFMDSLSYAFPRHTLRAGFELRRIQNNFISDPLPRGAFDFTGLMTSQLNTKGEPINNTGSDFADFLLGLPSDTSIRFGAPNAYFRSWEYIGYVQDDWRIRPSFTLAYGVRYEVATPPAELFNHISNLELNADISKVAQVTPGMVNPFTGQTTPRALVNGDYSNWAPRVGIAWRPFASLPFVARAGYSIFYNESIYNQLSQSLFDQPPFATSQTLLTSTNQVLTLENGFPTPPSTKVRNTTAVDPNYRTGYAQVWNLDVETRLQHNWILDFVYTGTKGTHPDMLRAPNRAPAGSVLTADQNRRIVDASGFIFDVSGASSTYHALQARVQRLLAHGMRIQALYTFAKSIDNASSIGSGGSMVVQDDSNFSAERGLSPFDIRHQFTGIYSYELPFGERHNWLHSGWASSVFSNLQISGVTTINSGQPFTALVNGVFTQTGGTGLADLARANQVGNPSLPSGQRTAQHWFNTNAFAIPGPGEFGDAARNTIPGPPLYNFDLGVARRMRFGKDRQYGVDFRWEMTNLFNTPNFNRLRTIVNATDFGGVRSALKMRQMEFRIRFHI